LIKSTPDILIVEDNKYNVEFILEALKEHNLDQRAKVFHDGREVLDYLFAATECSDLGYYKQPIVIILDLKLPKIDGIEVLRKIKSNEKTKMVPVVVFSSSTEDRDREECYRLGANSYITKPISYENFVKTAAEIGIYWAMHNMPSC
jgi:two-component system, response regulator